MNALLIFSPTVKQLLLLLLPREDGLVVSFVLHYEPKFENKPMRKV
jgi:hypothetical protein